MSGVYIKGMEMPCCCDECRFLDEYGDCPCCIITGEQRGYNFKTREKHMDKCHLVPVPPHGRLIDAEKIGLTDFEIIMCNGNYKEALKMLLDKIEATPTIIPAEEGE